MSCTRSVPPGHRCNRPVGYEEGANTVNTQAAMTMSNSPTHSAFECSRPAHWRPIDCRLIWAPWRYTERTSGYYAPALNCRPRIPRRRARSRTSARRPRARAANGGRAAQEAHRRRRLQHCQPAAQEIGAPISPRRPDQQRQP